MEMISENMGYDRAITTFSPDGRLFQVEYAREAVKKGGCVVSICLNKKEKMIIFCTKKRQSNIVLSIEKIFKIDDHIAAASAGLIADARLLIEDSRIKAQQNQIMYDEPISVFALAKYIADKKQVYTQYAGVRPYGVSLLIGGINNKARLYETDPSGFMVEAKASDDVSVMTAHTCDAYYRTWLEFVPAQEHKKGTMHKIFWETMHTHTAWSKDKLEYKGEVPEVEKTYAYLNTAYPCLNEKQLAIGESSISGHKELRTKEF